MDWLHANFSWALLAVPLVLVAFLWTALQRQQAAAAFGESVLFNRLTETVSTRRRRWKAAFVILALLAWALALMGPRFGTKVREVSREGVDLMIALDVSNSMLAEDVAPNRLKKAKFELSKLLDRLSGDRVGLIVFGADAFVQCPMTLDYSALRLFLDISDPSQMPAQGTNFDRMLEVAIKAFSVKGTDKDSKQDRSKVLLVISDGEATIGGTDELRAKAAEAGITLFAAGVGETAGTNIPLYLDGKRTESFKRDRRGEPVITKLEEDALQSLSQDGGYFRIARTTSNLNDFTEVLTGMERTKFGATKFAAYEEQYQWPLLLGILLLAVESIWRERRNLKKSKPISSIS